MAGTASGPLRILNYSSNALTREQVRLALGTRPSGPARAELYRRRDRTDGDPADGRRRIRPGDPRRRSHPFGGMGIAKQLKDEIADCPPILVLTGRADDAWLANWSRAEAAVPHPIDPIRLADAVAGLLRSPAG